MVEIVRDNLEGKQLICTLDGTAGSGHSITRRGKTKCNTLAPGKKISTVITIEKGLTFAVRHGLTPCCR